MRKISMLILKNIPGVGALTIWKRYTCTAQEITITPIGRLYVIFYENCVVLQI